MLVVVSSERKRRPHRSRGSPLWFVTIDQLYKLQVVYTSCITCHIFISTTLHFFGAFIAVFLESLECTLWNLRISYNLFSYFAAIFVSFCGVYFHSFSNVSINTALEISLADSPCTFCLLFYCWNSSFWYPFNAFFSLEFLSWFVLYC